MRYLEGGGGVKERVGDVRVAGIDSLNFCAVGISQASARTFPNADIWKVGRGLACIGTLKSVDGDGDG